ncbi:MAG: hypothetical protein Q7V88_13520 [Actinomycetota bacterium]|nr:hypothetical protein [Actinomycetota bacterium]
MPGMQEPTTNEPLVVPAGGDVGNPLLDAFRDAMALGTTVTETTVTETTVPETTGFGERRAEAIARYGFAIPTEAALAVIRHHSPAGVVEIGAGTGYWAHLLQQRGVDVVAFDPEPAPSPQNTWFAGTPPWHPVHRGDHDTVSAHPERTLLIVWPTKDETWAATAAQRFHDAGGRCLVFVGEGPGGRTGDATFHAVLGELATCLHCAYGSLSSPCTCGVEPQWQRTQTVELPHWPGFSDDLHVYAAASPRGGAPRRFRRRYGRRPATNARGAGR